MSKSFEELANEMLEDQNRMSELQPSVTVESARDYIEAHWNVKIKEDLHDNVKLLDSYDDCNVFCRCVSNKPQEDKSNTSTVEYCLKMHNGVFSIGKNDLLQAQNAILLYLNEKGFIVPVPTISKTGNIIETVSHEAKNGQNHSHCLRLLKWVPGKRMCDVSCTLETIANTGSYLAQLNNVLDSFDHIGIHRVFMWDMRQTMSVSSFLYAIKDETNRTLVQEILDDFCTTVLPLYEVNEQHNVDIAEEKHLRRGVIMGDFNDGNIILSSDDHTKVQGLIDFGDIVHSFIVNELAVGMAYAMLSRYVKDAKDDIEGHILEAAVTFYREYTKIRPLLPAERSVLLTIMVSRLAMSTTLGAFSVLKQPENEEYLSLHSVPAWNAIKILREDNLRLQKVLDSALDDDSIVFRNML